MEGAPIQETPINWNDRLGDQDITEETIKKQEEALSTLDSIKYTKISTKEGLIADLDRRKESGSLSEGAYNLIMTGTDLE